MARKRLGELLQEAGLVDELQLASALAQQRQWGGRLGTILVQMRLVSEYALVQTLAHQLTLPVVRLVGREIEPAVLGSVARELCETHHLLPFARTKNERGIETLHVAMSDPTNLGVVDELAFRTGKRIEVAVAGDRDLELAIRHHFYGERYSEQTRVSQLAGARLPGVEIELQGADAPPLEVVERAPVVLELGENDIALDDVPHLVPVAPILDAEPPPVAPVVVHSAPGAAAAHARPAPAPLTMRERLLEQTLAAELGTDGVPDRKLVLALARLLMRKGVFTEDEWIAEVARK